MPYVVGTDEAGYGPNLGPLVISATLWEVDDGIRSDDLYRVLESCVSRTAENRRNASPRLAIADSKTLYQGGGGLRGLELGVLAALAALDCRPATWREVWDALARASAAHRQPLPWYADYDAPLPLDAECGRVDSAARRLAQGMAHARVRLAAIRSRAIFPSEFNDLVARHGSKGAVLSHATLGLAAELIEPIERGPIAVVCDKHGGRNRYYALLTDHFPDGWIDVGAEGREQSVYRFGPGERRVEIRFQTKAESHLSVALASMASKYLRELAMGAFNEFWRRRVAGLRPTAGYPQDARRFKADIAGALASLGIDDRQLWRAR